MFSQVIEIDILSDGRLFCVCICYFCGYFRLFVDILCHIYPKEHPKEFRLIPAYATLDIPYNLLCGASRGASAFDVYSRNICGILFEVCIVYKHKKKGETLSGASPPC